MTIKFNGITKHGRMTFAPGVATSFEDPDAERYCVTMGWAEETNEKPVVEYPEGTFVVDPLTVHADGERKGLHVLPDLAAKHLERQEG